MGREIKRPVLRYFGGKFGNMGTLADRIIAALPPHRIYCEPFGGAASVLMRKPRAYAEIYNDLAEHVVTVFRVLRDPVKAKRLEELLRLTPFSRTEFAESDDFDGLDDVEIARRVMFRSCAGFGSAAASNPAQTTGFRANSNRSNTAPAQDWKNYPEMVPLFVERLRGVVIENRPAVEVIVQQDSPETLFYVDPPYLHATRSREDGYVHEMADGEHVLLAGALRAAKGMVVLSGYASALYESLYAGWERVELASVADGARPRTEVIWFNAAATSARRLPLERVIG